MAYGDKITEVNLESSGFVSKEYILQHTTEEQIFELIFKFLPQEFDYVTSPFRVDRSPGCWFERDLASGKLRFTDFADNRTINGVKMINIDCFDAIMVYYNIRSFFKALQFIKEKLIDGKDIHLISNIRKEDPKIPQKKPKQKSKILVKPRPFQRRDKVFWFDRYGIEKDQLIEDKVFPISKFKVSSEKTQIGGYTTEPTDATYAYTEFKSLNKKIYRPYASKAKRFLTNCVKNDIGGMNTPIISGRLLIITKSYKDFRVLKNFGLNVRWLQNEGMTPDSDEFWELVKNFRKIVVWFDNDDAGISAAKILTELINFTEIDKATALHLPTNLLKYAISDPSDLIHKMGHNNLLEFLKSKRIL